MDLRSTTPEQVSDLIDWMLDQADLSPPGPPQHAERCLAMKERAWFLKEIVLPKLQVQSRMVSLSIAEGVNSMPERPDSMSRTNGFLRGKGPGTEAVLGISADAPEGLSEAAQPS